MVRIARTWTVALALGVIATIYVIADKDAPEPSEQSFPPATETDSVAPVVTPQVEPISSTEELGESNSEPQSSSEETAAETMRTMIEVMGPSREALMNDLIQRGLAPADSDLLSQRFVEGFADCLFEAARKEHEARGKLDGTEMSWTQLMAYLSLNRVQSASVPCVGNVSQQTGIPLPTNFGTAGSQADSIPAELAPPPWAANMEALIRDHVASYSVAAIKTVLVSCSEQGCNIVLVGRDIRIFDLEFDVFAERNGFQHAKLGGDSNLRFVWLQR